jgi:SEC-C motif
MEASAKAEESGEALTAVNTKRNDPCPCGSGRKYKQCCLAKDEAAEREALEIASRRADNPFAGGGATAFRLAIDRVRKYNPRKLRAK